MDLIVHTPSAPTSQRSSLHRLHQRGRQMGAALVLALFVMLALLILGISATRHAANAERAARGERDRAIAFQAAEAALADAESDIEGRPGQSAARARQFEEGAGFPASCGAGVRSPEAGLCAGPVGSGVPAWQRVGLADSADLRAVPYGTFSGRSLPVGRGALPVRLPRYLIESLPYVQPGADAGSGRARVFRITAIGFGANETTQVVLQSYYLKPALEGGAP